MNSLPLLFPFLVSMVLGFLLCGLCLKDTKSRDVFFEAFLAGGLGLGISSFLTFFAFVLTDGFHPPAIMILHLGALVVLFVLFYRGKRLHRGPAAPGLTHAAGIIILLLFLGPVWIFAKYYPFGGWDAWAVWNFKARFLFLAGERWKELFLPELWRSSPHYPLLLPMINVWIWSFVKTPLQAVPLIVGVVFTVFTAGVLMFSLMMERRKKALALLAPALMLSLPHFLILATNQYADIVLGYYLLSAGVCLHRWLSREEDGYSFLAALFLGCLAFTKPEGFVAAGILVLCTLGLAATRKNLRERKRPLVVFLFILAGAMLPVILFKLLYSPGNQSFINGFLSAENPSGLLRLRFIIAFYAAEWTAGKWNGLGWIILAGVLLGIRRSFHKENLLIPLFLLSYLAVVTAYYWVNTYFEIQWWLQQTLSRILLALIPLVLFWIFSSVNKEDTK